MLSMPLSRRVGPRSRPVQPGQKQNMWFVFIGVFGRSSIAYPYVRLSSLLQFSFGTTLK